MKRKAVAAVLTAVMVASMFTGCGSDNGSSSAKSASAASAASAANDTVDEDGKVNGIMYQEGLPLVDEEITPSLSSAMIPANPASLSCSMSSKNRPM